MNKKIQSITLLSALAITMVAQPMKFDRYPMRQRLLVWDKVNQKPMDIDWDKVKQIVPYIAGGLALAGLVYFIYTTHKNVLQTEAPQETFDEENKKPEKIQKPFNGYYGEEIFSNPDNKTTTDSTETGTQEPVQSSDMPVYPYHDPLLAGHSSLRNFRTTHSLLSGKSPFSSECTDMATYAFHDPVMSH